MKSGLLARSLDRVALLRRGGGRAAGRLSQRQRDRLRAQLHECASGRGGEVTTRLRAARLGETYLQLDDAGRHEFLRMIAVEFGPEPAAVTAAHAVYQNAVGTAQQWEAEAGLRAALRSSRIRILTQFNAVPQGIKFLVDMRADLLRYLPHDAELAVLDRELEARLTAWFDVGFLELQRIGWKSPAALLEKLIQYEAVHEIRSWDDLRNRLDSDRRCYAFFHPRMPMEPLIFVEVALTDRLAASVQSLLDEKAPVFDARRADTAIFYSISNTQKGLRGVSFGNFLLKRVIDDLKRDFPRLKTYSTLSPMPQLAAWVRHNPGAMEEVFTPADAKKISGALKEPWRAADLAARLASGEWAANRRLAEALRDPMLRVAARYLFHGKDGPRISDPVARFHLANGARIERINWLADTSPKGYQQSFGMMVNYLYDPEAIEDNVEAFAAHNNIAASTPVRRLLKS